MKNMGLRAKEDGTMAMTQAERERDALCEDVDRLASDRDLFAKALLECEWREHGGPVYSCHGCHHSWSYQKVHRPDCRVDAALTKLGYPTRESRDKALTQLYEADSRARWGHEALSQPPRVGDDTAFRVCGKRYEGSRVCRLVRGHVGQCSE